MKEASVTPAVTVAAVNYDIEKRFVVKELITTERPNLYQKSGCVCAANFPKGQRTQAEFSKTNVPPESR